LNKLIGEYKMAKRELKVTKKRDSVKWEFPLGKQNLIIIGIGLIVILIGYALMATGITEEAAVADGKWNNALAVVVAPFLLVIGYCVIIPFGIIKTFTNKEAA